jgi:hypothetical protein
MTGIRSKNVMAASAERFEGSELFAMRVLSRQVAPEGTTLYFDAFGVHAELFVAATTQWCDFIGSGGSMLGVRVLHPDNA